ncbi:ubiquitin domain-containing protein DSK2b-like [Camellia sinensis]|uniref:ubiquitin domain-containing protein DSK2b-like n=1 Tax=Camellia sinensis TaxID=4442 RepID=UPI0010358772|nr:ubiquitin domain-containing protein DSK2b-like [Camellia sinensis]
MICSKLMSLKTKAQRTLVSSSPSGPAYTVENSAHQAGGAQTNSTTRSNLPGDARLPAVGGLGGLGLPEMFGSMQDTASLSQFAQNPAVSQMMQVLLSNPQYMNQDTIIGFLLAGVDNVDLRRKTNYLIVDSKTTVKQIEEAFKEFTTREDVVIVMISQYVSFCSSLSYF